MAASTQIDNHEASCCIVGGGPGGLMLGLLLARRGIATTLLELHKDFDRDFRGDTVHPYILAVMGRPGLAERLLELPHARMDRMILHVGGGDFQVASFAGLKTPYPFVAMMPQARFLDFLAQEARKYPNFQLLMGANVDELIEEQGNVRGVRYRREGDIGEVRAILTVGADGRFSRVRKLGGFEAITTSPPMDIVWFRIARRADDVPGGMGQFGRGHILVMLDRGDTWQIGFVIIKGSFREVREGGLDAFKKMVGDLVPHLADRLDTLTDWKQVALLSIESDRLKQWYKPGLLMIGDAAHVMSPVGGNGINYAVQDAVAASNELTGPLLAGRVVVGDLARVQRSREWPTRLIQGMVTAMQNSLIKGALNPDKPAIQIPWLLRLLPFQRLPAQMMGLGILPPKLPAAD